MKLRFSMCITVMLLLLIGCDKNDPQVFQPGQITFSFEQSNSTSGGRVKDQEVPAFVSYSLKKSDGSMISNKIELYEFNGSFVTQPQPLDVGHYSLEQFLILDIDNKVIYAAPLFGSELADLVEHSLPLDFTITTDETTNVVPEVLALEDHTPADFGYVSFAYQVIEKFDFNVGVTIADHAAHEAIDYTLEIIAKDAPLGNIKWTKTISATGASKIHVPVKYAHYTFKAVKAGYIPHVQHFLNAELSGYDALDFEFIPQTLDGFIMKEFEGGDVKLYFPNDQYRYKLYARADVAEGYFVFDTDTDKNASSISGYPAGEYVQTVCEPPRYSHVSVCKKVNLFDNVPFASAQDLTIDLTQSNQTPTLDDVDISTKVVLTGMKHDGSADLIIIDFQMWKGINNK